MQSIPKKMLCQYIADARYARQKDGMNTSNTYSRNWA